MWFNELQAVSTLHKRRVMESNLSMIFWNFVRGTVHYLYYNSSPVFIGIHTFGFPSDP